MIPKDINDITTQDIENLITNKIQESITLEYKEELKYDSYEDRKEFLADLSAFANASGGDLIFGISAYRDNNGHPTGEAYRAIGVPVDNWDELKNTLINIIRNSVQPHIPSVSWNKVDGFERGPVVIARILKSWIAPHMVVSQKSRRFYTRTSAGKFLMDAAEIRSAFLRTAGMEEKVRQFRDIRLSSILTGSTPLPMPMGPKFVVHLLPFSHFENEAHLNFEQFPRRINPVKNRYSDKFRPLWFSDYQYLRNFDGYVNYSRGSDSLIHSYTQIFRNGAIEAVYYCKHQDQKTRMKYLVDVYKFELNIIERLPDYLRGFRELNVPLPQVLLITLIEAKDYKFALPEKTSFDPALVEEHLPIDRDVLALPEIMIDDYKIVPTEILKTAFDVLWNSVGIDSAPTYNPEGKWRGY